MSVKFKEGTQWCKLFYVATTVFHKNLTKPAEGTIGCKMLQLLEPLQSFTYCSVLEVRVRLLAISCRKTTNPINKREIPASGKFTKYSKCSLLTISVYFSKELAARHLYLMKLSKRSKRKTPREQLSGG